MSARPVLTPIVRVGRTYVESDDAPDSGHRMVRVDAIDGVRVSWHHVRGYIGRGTTLLSRFRTSFFEVRVPVAGADRGDVEKF